MYLCAGATIIPKFKRLSSDQDNLAIVYDTLLHKPRNSGRLAALMELYERNYVLVRLLVPGLRHLGEGVHVSRLDGSLPLELSAIEQSRFTTTFNLSYRFTANQRGVAQPEHVGRREREPDLMIRIYHDARTCEVMSGLIPSIKQESRRVRDLEQGYRLNRFLDKWLNYCLRQGHSFGGAPGITSDPGSIGTDEASRPVADRIKDPLLVDRPLG